MDPGQPHERTYAHGSFIATDFQREQSGGWKRGLRKKKGLVALFSSLECWLLEGEMATEGCGLDTLLLTTAFKNTYAGPLASVGHSFFNRVFHKDIEQHNRASTAHFEILETTPHVLSTT